MSSANILLEWTEKLVQTDFASLTSFSVFDEFRERYKAVVAPGQEFYELWLKEVVLTANFLQLTNLVNDFVEQYPVFDIAASVMDVIMKFYEEDLVEDTNSIRQLLETVLAYCGHDIMTGSLLWQKLIDFEVEEHEDLLEALDQTTHSTEIRKSKERLHHTCERQLSLPLVGNETAILRLEKLLAEYFTENDVNLIRPDLLSQRIENAMILRDSRLIFEQQLFLDPSTTTSNSQNSTFHKTSQNTSFDHYLQTWKTYIAFELQEKQFARVERLFWRLSTTTFATFFNTSEQTQNHVFQVELYFRFVIFTYAQMKRPGKVLTILKRLWLHENQQLRVISRQYMWFHKIRLFAMEQQSQNTWLNILQTRLVPDALQSGFLGADDYLEFFCTCVSSVHRVNNKNEVVFEEIVQFFSYLGEMTINYFPTWSEGQLIFHRLCADVLLSIKNKNPEKIAAKDEKSDLQAIKGQFDSLLQLYPDQYWVYYEMITFYINHSLFTQVTAVYRRIIHIKHWQDGVTTNLTVLKAWLRYEEDCALASGDGGLLEGLKSCLVKHHELFVQMAMANLYASNSTQQQQQLQQSEGQGESTATANANAAATSNRQKSEKSGNSKKRGRDDDDDDNIRQQHQQQQQRQSTSSTGRETEAVADDDSNRATKKQRTVTFTAAESEQPQPPAPAPQQPVPQGLQIALRNLHYNFTAKELELMLKSKQLSFKSTQLMRGLAVITLRPADRDNTDPGSVLQHWQQALYDATSRGRPVEVSIATPHDHELLAEKAKEQIPQKTTVFISRLPASIDSEEKLQEIFAVYGPIVASKLAVDKVTGISKGTALVEYAQEEGRNAALKAHKVLEVDGQVISVTVSKFPVQAPASPAAAVGTGMDVEGAVNEDNDKVQVKTKEVKNKKPAATAAVSSSKGSADKVTAFRPRNVAMKPKLHL